MFRLYLIFLGLPLYSHMDRYNIYYDKEQDSRDRHSDKLSHYNFINNNGLLKKQEGKKNVK